METMWPGLFWSVKMAQNQNVHCVECIFVVWSDVSHDHNGFILNSFHNHHTKNIARNHRYGQTPDISCFHWYDEHELRIMAGVCIGVLVRFGLCDWGTVITHSWEHNLPEAVRECSCSKGKWSLPARLLEFAGRECVTIRKRECKTVRVDDNIQVLLIQIPNYYFHRGATSEACMPRLSYIWCTTCWCDKMGLLASSCALHYFVAWKGRQVVYHLVCLLCNACDS